MKAFLLPTLFGFLIASSLFCQTPDTIRFAAIGDYGDGGPAERDVADLVKSWKPAFIITLGDNNYPRGSDTTIDDHIGRFYHEFIAPYNGAFGVGAADNRFFPSLGNHDWRTPGAVPYLDYFTLPGNERYYEFVRGPVHFFVIDSDPHEPDGVGVDGAQARWLRDALARATEPWKIVYMHHPPYSSGNEHGNTPSMQWPFHLWGADVVMAGHEHTYERIERDSMLYFVNGLGGATHYGIADTVVGSRVRYAGDYGAMLIEATPQSIVFRFIDRSGREIDRRALDRATTAVPRREEPGSAEAPDLSKGK